MEVHCFIALLVRAVFCEARTTTFDLHSAARFLLNVFHISSSMTYYLRSKIEARDRFKVDWNLFLGPLSSAILITFKLLGLATFESPFVNQIREILFHHFVDLFYSLFKTFFRGAGDMQVQRWILISDERRRIAGVLNGHTAAVAILLSG